MRVLPCTVKENYLKEPPLLLRLLVLFAADLCRRSFYGQAFSGAVALTKMIPAQHSILRPRIQPDEITTPKDLTLTCEPFAHLMTNEKIAAKNTSSKEPTVEIDDSARSHIKYYYGKVYYI